MRLSMDILKHHHRHHLKHQHQHRPKCKHSPKHQHLHKHHHSLKHLHSHKHQHSHNHFTIQHSHKHQHPHNHFTIHHSHSILHSHTHNSLRPIATPAATTLTRLHMRHIAFSAQRQRQIVSLWTAQLDQLLFFRHLPSATSPSVKQFFEVQRQQIHSPLSLPLQSDSRLIESPEPWLRNLQQPR